MDRNSSPIGGRPAPRADMILDSSVVFCARSRPAQEIDAACRAVALAKAEGDDEHDERRPGRVAGRVHHSGKPRCRAGHTAADATAGTATGWCAAGTEPRRAWRA